MATAREQALATINQKFADDQIDAETYQELLTAVAGMDGEVTQPVKTTAAKPTALSDPSRRAYIQVNVSDDFSFGHLTLVKQTGKYTRRMGVWAEEVTDFITQLTEKFDELPEDVQEAALSSSEEE